MLFRISLLDQELAPVLYRRPFSGISELEPSLLAMLSRAVRDSARIVTENEIFSVKVVNDLFMVVSHDGDDTGVEQAYQGIKEHLSENKPIDKEVLHSIRSKLKPSSWELRNAVKALEGITRVSPRRQLNYIKPHKNASEKEMRNLFLAGDLEGVIKIIPRTPLMAAMYVKSAIILETLPAKYARADPSEVERYLSMIADRQVIEFLKACYEHVRSSSRELEVYHIKVYRENIDYFYDLIRSDIIRAPILLYPVGDQTLYKIVKENFTGYRSIIASLYAGLRDIAGFDSVREFLSVRPKPGNDLEYLISLALTAFSRDVMRYIASDKDVEKIIAEMPLIRNRFLSLIEQIKKEPPIPVSIMMLAIAWFASHIYRLLGAYLMLGRRAGELTLKGLRKTIDEAMKLLSDYALQNIIKPYVLADVSVALTESLYAVTKARGETFDPRKIKYLKYVAAIIGRVIDSRYLTELERRSDRSSFFHLIDLSTAIVKLYSILIGDEYSDTLRKMLERSLLSIHIEDLPLKALDILDALSYAYKYSKPSHYALREIIGYVKRLAMYSLVLKVALFRMVERFSEIGHSDLVELVKTESGF